MKKRIESTSAPARNDNKRLAVKGKWKRKKDRAAKDPNKPKKPSSAFFIFMESFRVEFKENHPGKANQSFSVISRAAGEKWREMSQAEKAIYIAKAQQMKKDYEKKMQIHQREQVYDGVGNKEDEDDA